MSKRSDQAGIRSWTKPARRYDRSSSFAVLGEVRDLLDFVTVILYVCQDLSKHVPDCARRFHAMSSQERSQLTESLVFSDVPSHCFHFWFRTLGVPTLWLRDTFEARLGSPQGSRLSTYCRRGTIVCLISRRYTQIMVSLSGVIVKTFRAGRESQNRRQLMARSWTRQFRLKTKLGRIFVCRLRWGEKSSMSSRWVVKCGPRRSFRQFWK